MFRWLRYKFALWRVNRNRRKAYEREFEEYMATLERLAGKTFTPWQRQVFRAYWGEYTKVGE